MSTAGIDSRPPASSSEAVLGEDQRIVLRDEIRRLLFDWARELATAETRGELVGVLARAGDYVDSISNAWTAAVEATGTLKDRESRRRTGSADRGSADSTRPTAPARPALRPGKRIQDYDAGELDALAQWVISNDPDRTDHAVIDVLCSELGFKRRGRRINAQLQSSVERVRGGRAL